MNEFAENVFIHASHILDNLEDKDNPNVKDWDELDLFEQNELRLSSVYSVRKILETIKNYE